MRVVRIIFVAIAGIIVVSVIVLYGPLFLRSPFHRFIDQDQKYYAKIARSCDLMLSQHPLGTNLELQVDVGDPSLPAEIHELQPTEIFIVSNGVHVIVRREFGIAWHAQADTNLWALEVFPEGPGRIVYVQRRHKNG